MNIGVHPMSLESMNSINQIKLPKTAFYEEVVNLVLENTQKGVILTNERNEIVYANKMFTNITGYSFEEVKGKSPKILQSGIQNVDFYDEMKKEIGKNNYWNGTVWNRAKNGDIYLQELEIYAFRDSEGKIENFLGFLSKFSEEEMQKFSGSIDIEYYDPLTSLPNRLLFEKRLHSTLQLVKRKEMNASLVFFQIQNFHEINETYGLLFGDLLLKRLAKRLENNIPINSMLSRWNGTTFAFVIEGYYNKKEVEETIEKFAKILTSPFVINGISVNITVNFGIALHESKQKKFKLESFLKNAKQALEQAKKRDETYCFYDQSMETNGHYVIMESDIIRAIKNKEFVLYYQPLLTTDSKKLAGFEALIRWHHPTEGFITPGDFIPLAEKTGLINNIGEYVFREACIQQVEWRNQGYGDLLVSVNLSMAQFQDESLVNFVSRTIHETGANPNYISIELTESSFSEDVENTVIKLKQLSDLGLTIAIDDFGTGYSSLGYLIDFPIHTIKIDRTFIKVIEENEKIEAIVKAINSMAKALNIKVVAEGIETNTQFELVKQLQCNIVQGFLFDRPQEPKIIEEKWLANFT